MMSIENFLNVSINDDTKELMWGINTVMFSLAPGAIYAVHCSEGNFNVIQWNENQGTAPTSEEIKKEYQRQETFVEFYNYLKNDQPEVFELLMKKLGRS